MSSARNEVDAQAARWVARMDTDQWTDRDEVELQDWLSADYARRGALLQAEAAWLSLDREANGPAIAPVAYRMPIFGRRRLILAGGSAIAATLAGGLVWRRSWTNYSTQLGEIRKVPLPDGSIATINSASEVDVRLADRKREVRIAKGEVWFQVAKDPHRPFVVEAGPVLVRAVGTAFSVRRRDQGADILVTEGVVAAWNGMTDGHRTRLTAGQHAYIGTDARVRMISQAPSEVDRTLAWRAGSIDLRGQALVEAVEEFNRYNRRKLVLDNDDLAGERFDGIFRTDDPEGFAAAISDSFRVPVDLDDPTEIRIGRRSR